jgi:hypothetical protein
MEICPSAYRIGDGAGLFGNLFLHEMAEWTLLSSDRIPRNHMNPPAEAIPRKIEDFHASGVSEANCPLSRKMTPVYARESPEYPKR